MKIELLTINYNTPELIKVLLGSVFKYKSKYNFDYVIVNNGPLPFLDDDNCFNILDLKDISSKYINELKNKVNIKLRDSKSVFGSAHHAFTIDYYIYNLSKADYILLFDTDVMVLDNFDDKIDYLINSNQPFYSCITLEDISGNKFKRVGPHCCFINRKKFIELKLKFLTENNFLDITHSNSYDTGRSLYENTLYMKLKYFDDNSFFKHLKGIFWKKVDGK